MFISANPSVNARLQSAANGNWVSWYVTFACAPLMIGYNPGSKFAADLKSKPWYQVIAQPGFKLGTTNPQVDPNGKFAQQALTDAAVGIVLGQTFVAAPVLIVAAQSAFAALDPALEDVAATLGHGRYQRFLWMVVALVTEAVVSATGSCSHGPRGSLARRAAQSGEEQRYCIGMAVRLGWVMSAVKVLKLQSDSAGVRITRAGVRRVERSQIGAVVQLIHSTSAPLWRARALPSELCPPLPARND